jgi:hypothetical protein
MLVIQQVPLVEQELFTLLDHLSSTFMLVIQQVPLVEQELLTLLDHLSSTLQFMLLKGYK